MKEALYAWYQGLKYEEDFGPDEVLYFQQMKRRIDTHASISTSEYFERQKLSGEDGIWAPSFFKSCNLCFHR